jgi:hypothetical protein
MEEPPSKSLKGMKTIHPDMPQIPFFVGIIGPRHSGKSVWLFNVLGDMEGMYGASFKKDNIVLYSPTKDKDPTLKKLKLKHMYGPPTSLEWIVNHLKSVQQGYMEANNMTGVLLVIDDATKLRNAWPSIEELSYTGRHDHIQTLYVAHKLSSVPRGVRTQTQQWILFIPHEESEKQWVYESFAPKEQIPLWRNAFMRAWHASPHNFIYIDYEEKDPNRIYRSGFHDPLFTAEELVYVTGEEMKQEEPEEEEDSSDEEIPI